MNQVYPETLKLQLEKCLDSVFLFSHLDPSHPKLCGETNQKLPSICSFSTQNFPLMSSSPMQKEFYLRASVSRVVRHLKTKNHNNNNNKF